ncbi:hypothetical protein BAU15_05295 [Enterococcus sp. JM4C]|uniref:hypothetical protein n=1 Tax=Candidatus Enterococcus huntleyi TaxID=1857217 RepID=UPI0013798DDF|nr:hypothetical protein [Enterococcus sp. JM4C]KAF1295168.1 hypothetical protein BAU15_05295 [Enterococcus sp. JM4C]
MKFKAKPIKEMSKEDLEYIEFKPDAEGYIHGFYVDGYIVGKVIEANSEYISLENWCPVDVDTLQMEDEE